MHPFDGLNSGLRATYVSHVPVSCTILEPGKVHNQNYARLSGDYPIDRSVSYRLGWNGSLGLVTQLANTKRGRIRYLVSP